MKRHMSFTGRNPMSRSSAFVIPILVALVWTSPTPAQDRNRVLETVRRLESRLEQVDNFIRGLQTAQIGAEQGQELQSAEFSQMRETLARTRTELSEQRQDAEAATRESERQAQALRLELQNAVQRAEAAEMALETAVSQRDEAMGERLQLTEQLDRADVGRQAMEGNIKALQHRAETAEERLIVAVTEERSARQDGARLAQQLDKANLGRQAMERDMQMLYERADAAEATLSAERDLLGELEAEVVSLKAQMAERDREDQVSEVDLLTSGLQVHIHGGEVTFQFTGLDLPRVLLPEQDPVPRDISNLRLRLRQDGAKTNRDKSDGAVPRLRIHLP